MWVVAPVRGCWYHGDMPLKDPEARRAYHREYMKTYLVPGTEAHRLHLARVKRNRARYAAVVRDWLDEYLSTHPCVDCGNDEVEVLEFDHVRGEKLFNVSEYYRKALKLARVMAEVGKCEVRWANCHRKVTRKRLRERSDWS